MSDSRERIDEQAEGSAQAPLYSAHDGTALQPDAPHDSLVQNEGVNAGSAAALGDDPDDVPPAEATVSGDGPATAPGDVGGEDLFRTGPAGTGGSSSAGRAQDEDQFVGAPAQEPGFPSTAAGPSGQDAGSMPAP